MVIKFEKYSTKQEITPKTEMPTAMPKVPPTAPIMSEKSYRRTVASVGSIRNSLVYCVN